MIRLSLLILIIHFSCFVVKAQSTVMDTATVATGVVVHADPRLALLTAALQTRPPRPGAFVSSRGYRVQIYNGMDRSEANRIKLDFVKHFPGIRTYLSYIQPQFRLKVGDFKSKGEAQRLYREINGRYSPIMIVPDIIITNTPKDD